MYDIKKIINSLDLYDDTVKIENGNIIIRVKYGYENYKICEALNLKKRNPRQKYYEVVL